GRAADRAGRRGQCPRPSSRSKLARLQRNADEPGIPEAETQGLDLGQYVLETVRAGAAVGGARQQTRGEVGMPDDKITTAKELAHLRAGVRRWKPPERFFCRGAPLNAGGLEVSGDERRGLRASNPGKRAQGFTRRLLVVMLELLGDRGFIAIAGESEDLNDRASRGGGGRGGMVSERGREQPRVVAHQRDDNRCCR